MTLSTTGDVSIAGDLTVDGAILDSNGVPGASGQILSSTVTGTDWVDLSEISGVDGSGTANYIAKWTDGDTIGNSVIYDNGTNVGLGTNSPDTSLEILAADPILTIRDVSTGLSDANATLRLAESGGSGTLGDYWDVKMAPEPIGGNTNFVIANKSLGEALRINYLRDISFRDSSNNEAFYWDASTARLGIGTSTPSAKLHIYNGEAIIATSTDGLKLSYSAGNSSGVIDTAFSDNNLEFRTNGTTKMWIANNGNVGIGVIPSSIWSNFWRPLQISSGSAIAGYTSGSSVATSISTNNVTVGNTYILNNKYLVDGPASLYLQDIDGEHSWYNAASGIAGNTITYSERMRIDSLGRVGINTSNPTNYLTLGLGGTASVPAIAIGQDTDTGWFRPADNAIGFTTAGTERMRIDSAGNVGIGTSSPVSKLESYTVTTGAIGASGLANIALSSNGAVDTRSIMTFGKQISGGYAPAYLGFITTDGTGNSKGDIIFGARSVTTDSAPTERMRVAASGNVGIGKIPTSGYKLDIEANNQRLRLLGTTGYVVAEVQNNGGAMSIGKENSSGGSFFPTTGAYDSVLASQGATNVVFGTNNAERMRITSGGFLKASNTGSYNNASGTYHEQVSNISSSLITNFQHTSSVSPYGIDIDFSNSSPNNSTNYFIYALDSTSAKFIVYSNGNVQNTNNSYGVISDIKLKENITDATPKLDDLMQVKIRNYNLIGEETKQLGVVAQELEQVFPALIDEHPDTEEQQVPQIDENGQEVLDENGDVVMTTERVDLGTTTKSVKMSVFVPMLIKAMQEQQEIINDLKSRIETLENN